MSLVELMVAISIISVGLLAFTGAFRFVSHSIRDARARSLAISLAQEKIENLKTVPYHKLQVTTVTATNNNFSPPVTYDTISYPPETIQTGGITFTRTVEVSLTRLAGNEVESLSSNYPDSGLKFITCNVWWQQRGTWKLYFIDSVYENPQVDPLNATVQGRVLDTGGNPVAGAVVTVLEKDDWTGTTDSAGSYLFRISGGTYSLRASSSAFYNSNAPDLLINESTTYTKNYTMARIATGTVSGNVFYTSNSVIIAQVVAGTYTNTASGYQNVEYIMLFNPTTYTMNLGSGWATDLFYFYTYNADSGSWTGYWNWESSIVVRSIPPYKGYVIANSSWFYIGNTWVRADAYNNGNDYLPENSANAVALFANPTWNFMDVLDWGDDDHPSGVGWYDPYSTPISSNSCVDGLGPGNFLVRYSSPGYISNGGHAWSYDTGGVYPNYGNGVEFAGPHVACNAGYHFPLMNWTEINPIRPFSTFDSTMTPIGGQPGIGAMVTANDLLSPSTIAYRATVTNMFGQSQPYARYALTGVSTGTWTVLVATNSYYVEYASVTVPVSGGVSIPNSVTTPVWDMTGVHVARATQTTSGGYISGLVTNVNNSPMSGIAVVAGGVSRTTGSNGRFFVSVTSGPQTVIVNPNNANTSYAENNSQLTVSQGRVSTMTVTLTQAGTLMGFLTPDGTSGLPNTEVTASRNGAQWGAAVTDTSGIFYLKNLSTGTYDVQPVLDPMEVYSPSSFTVSVVASRSIHVGTFTITGAEGKIGGSISMNGSPLTTGALILVSTATLGATPPKIVASSAPAQTTMYMGSSKADGTYLIDVRGSTTTTYRVNVYVPSTSPSAVTVSTKVYTGVVIYSTGTTTLNLVLP